MKTTFPRPFHLGHSLILAFGFLPVCIQAQDCDPDILPPQITCPADQTIVADGNCEALVSDFLPLAVVSDNCDTNPQLEQSPSVGTSLNGPQTITLTATDQSGNSANCTFLLTPQDTTAPAIQLPSDVSLNCGQDDQPPVSYCQPIPIIRDGLVLPLSGNGSTQLKASDFDLGSIDDCESGSLQFSFSPLTTDTLRSYNCNDIGSHNLNIYLTDANGNQSWVQSWLEVQDPVDHCTNPTACGPQAILRPGIVLNLPEDGEAVIDASLFDVASQDACSTGSLEFSFSIDAQDDSLTVDCDVLGTLMVEVWVTDGNGNQSFANCFIEIQDQSAICTPGPAFCSPLIVVEPGVIAGMPANRELILTPATFALDATDVCGEGNLVWTINNEASEQTLDCTDLGGQVITLELTDGDDNQTVVETNLQLQDNTDACSGTGFATATDNCDLAPLVTFQDAITPDGCPQSYTIIRTWTATDVAGNSSSADQTISVEDTSPPSISCPDPQTESLDANCQFVIPDYTGMATAGDNCDQSPAITQSPTPGTVVSASAIITLTATDACGNTADCTFELTLLDDIAPTFNCPSDADVLLDANCEYSIPDYSQQINLNDNCDTNPMLVQDPPAGTLISEAALVSLDVSDASGNMVSCSFTLTTLNTGPGLSHMPADTTVYCASDVPGQQGVTGYDPCDGQIPVFYTQTDLPPGCPGEGTVINTWIVQNAEDQSFSYSQTVTIQDTVAPVFVNLPNDTTVNCANQVPWLQEVAAFDNCGEEIDVIVQQGPAPDCVGSGEVVISFIAIDCAGNSSVHNQVVTIDDNTPPVLSATPADLIVDCSDAVPGDPGITATDNCGETISVEFEQTALPDCPGGFAQVSNTWTAADCAGNETTWTQTITIDDNTDPILSALPADLTVECVDDVPADQGITATDNCNEMLNVQFAQSPLPDCSDMGEVTNTWTVSDCSGNTVVHVQTVTIDHQEDPIFSVYPTSITVDCAFDVPGDQGITATSYCGETLTVNFSQTAPPTCVGNGAVVNTWTATDCNGNFAQHSQFVTIEDTEGPVLSEEPADLTLPCVFDVPGDPGVTATDNCGEPVDVVFTQSGLSTTCPGSGTVTNTWTATDCAGNTSTHIQTITLDDTVAPVLSSLPANVSVICVEDAPGDPGITATDNCGEELTVVFSQSPAPACPGSGSITNTWTVTDCAGNTTTHDQIVSIQDNTIPVLSHKPADVTVACLEDIPGEQGVTATDNCDANVQLSYIQEGLPLQFPNPDPVTNTWIATDCAGNETIHVQTITVLDEEAPVANCSGLTVLLDQNGSATVSAEVIGDGSSDNCGIAAYLIDNGSFSCADIGENEVLLTVVDAFENTNSCIAIVNVMASPACTPPAIQNNGGPTISDPCTCRGNGEFDEEIVIGPTGSGQDWEVLTTDLINPASMQPYATGTPFIEQPDGMGQFIYTLAGIHLDGQGYTLQAVSPSFPGEILEISNTCYYPEPEILGLDDVYCQYSDPQALEGDVGGVFLESETWTINDDPAMIFDPLVLGVGQHVVTYTVDAGTAGSNDPNDPGCVASTSVIVNIESTPATLACNDNITISTDEDCEVLITPDMILEGSYGCYDDYDVTVNLGINEIPNPVTGDYLDELLTVTITHLVSGNSCSGEVTITDQLAPVFNCSSTPIQISCTEETSNVPNPIATDNCTAVTYQLIGEVVLDDDPCGDNIVLIQQTWTATDAFGNISQPCIQLIEIIRPDDIDFPNDIVWECDQYDLYPNIVEAESLHPQVEALQNGIDIIEADGISSAAVLSNTGSGIPLDFDGQYCNYGYAFSDQTLSDCGSAFQIVRTWTVLDWCTQAVITENQAGEDNIQIIKVKDLTPPVVSLSPFTVSANVYGQHPQPCTSQDFLLPPVVSDNCHDWTVYIFTPVGEAVYANGIDGSNGGLIPAPGLQIGFHTITYQVIDECGNQTNLNVQIEVIDDIAPVAICDEITEVNLSSNGLAVVPADIFDDGSLDNCGVDYFEVRRIEDNCGLPGNLQFGPAVTFCCEDIPASPITVVMRVYDYYGNFNECMVVVNVDDAIPPIISNCPAPISINCEVYHEQFAVPLNTGNYSVLDQFGEPLFYDNCEVIPDYQVSININACLEGSIVRTWTSVDGVGNASGSCTQTISVEHLSNFAIEFPDDLEVTCEDGNLPDFGYPEIFNDECEMVGISWDDQYFYVVPDACYKIIRTWTAVNWCIYDEFGEDVYAELNEVEAGIDFDGDGDLDEMTYQDGINDGTEADGYIVHQQTIKIIDNTAPTFTIPTVDGCIVEQDCDKDLIIPFPVIEDDCSEEFEVDIDGSFGSFNDVSGDVVVADVVPGDYVVNYAITDNCGNTAFETVNFTVEDCKLPSPYCLNGADIEIMQTGMIEVIAATLDLGSFDNCPGDLLFSFSPDVSDTSNIYTCDDIGIQAVEIWVTDAAGNQDFCETYIDIQDNMDVCNEADIAGQIATEDYDMVANVMVNVNGGMFMDMTDEEGEYLITVPTGADYTVAPYYDEETGNGVSTLDMLYIQQHILGLAMLDSPYKIIAADANNSESITTLDLLAIQKVILGLETEFPNNTSWRFVDAAYVFPDTLDPWTPMFPEVVNFNNLSSDQLTADFVGVKIGDVNLSASTNLGEEGENRSFDQQKALLLPNSHLYPGEVYEIPIRIKDVEMLGCQFSLSYDPELLEIVELEKGLSGENQIAWFKELGSVSAIWSGIEAPASESNDVLFSLKLTVNRAIHTSELFVLSNRPTSSEAYSANSNIYGLEFSFEGKSNPRLLLLPNYPNPSVGITNLRYVLPDSGQVQLRITDISGKVIREENWLSPKGYNEKHLQDLPRGILFYTIEGPGGRAAGRMVVE
ncbi:MAG: HYR domain-containing protein [Bacteroidetes bacterium]|nr:HYR domain-containing protein [Bacteroidota bacterium]